MKTSSIAMDKEYMDLVNMTPKEISRWLNTLVEGLLQKKASSDTKSTSADRD